MRRCRWVKDAEVEGGRFLVPGCWNRALYGDHADCHCPPGSLTRAEIEREIATAEAYVADLRRQLERKRP